MAGEENHPANLSKSPNNSNNNTATATTNINAFANGSTINAQFPRPVVTTVTPSRMTIQSDHPQQTSHFNNNRNLGIGLTFPLKSAPQSANSVNSVAGVDGNHNASDPWDKGAENSMLMTINDRKIRLSSTSSESLYALCRRWIRNDRPRKDQHIPMERPLPRPLSAGSSEVYREKSTSDREESADTETSSEIEMDEPIESLSQQELLELHVNRARKVRERLANERSKRIERYRQRLALLLPPRSV